MSDKEFVHLHLHTQYSLLDGAVHIDRLMDKLKADGSSKVAITDHGTMHGIVDFYKTALKNDIKPILGCEVYVAPDDRRNRDYQKEDDKNYHFILLAKNNTGLKNLQYLCSRAQLEGFYYKPRIDKEILAQFSEGLIGTSACLGGELPQKIMRNDYEGAMKSAMEIQDILGKGDFFLEIQDNGMEEQVMVNRNLIHMSKETGIPLVATNDCHYLTAEDYYSHQVLMCIQYQMTVNSDKNVGGHTNQLWVKSPEEMWASFGTEVPEALTNTVKIADMCNTSIEFGKLHLPVYEVPEGYTLDSYFTHLCRVGLRKKLATISEDLHDEYWARLEVEFDVIIPKGFAGYYLIVWDFMNWSRENDVPVGPGRGSGAGSLAAFVLGITDIDPIRFDLLFERFLNPERESMPDFDIDFCVNGRERVINYVREKYGNDRVAQIATFGKLLGRGSVKDVARVLEVPLADATKLAKLIPEAPGMTLKKAMNSVPDFEKEFLSIEGGAEVLKHAQNIEGLFKTSGMHAAGIVIGDKPLEEYVPLWKGKNDEVITQYEKDTVEGVGLVKFDFLGLKNLTIIDAAVKNIKDSKGEEIDMISLPLDDKSSYELLCRGDSTGVFQLESEGMKNLLKKLKPTVFEDIIALVALYRPGPMESGMLDSFVKRKHGEEEIDYMHDNLKDYLKETYGLIIYQEQVMQIARTMGGYSLGAADLLRRAMGKKKADVMAQQKSVFIDGDEKMNIEGAVKRGYDRKQAEDIFNIIEKFAAYGFNKSHSAAYGLIAYQTAYLKANYPVEYMAGLLSCELGNIEKVVVFIEECKKMGITVLPPDINESRKDFTIIGDTIRFGLGAIKNVGFGAIDSIVENREKDGKYESIYDFCNRVDLRQANKKVLEALIKAGAFDSTGKNRRQLLQVLENAIEDGQRKQKMANQGILSIEEFLGGGEDGEEENDEYYPDVEEMDENELLLFEKEMLGFYLTNHPLAKYSSILEIFTELSSKFAEKDDESDVIVGGIVKGVKNHITKTSGKKMAFVTLEDLHGDIDVVIFSDLYAENIRYLEEDKILIIAGTISKKGVGEDMRISVIANEIGEVSEAMEKMTKGILIKLNAIGFTEDRVSDLKHILGTHKGELPVHFEVERPAKYRVRMKLSDDFKVSPKFSLFKQLDDLLGEKRFEVMIKKPENGNGKKRNGRNGWKKKYDR